jgi:uncharacterized protein
LVKGDRLMKAMARGKMSAGAELEDYAYVVQGLLDHADATGNRSPVQGAKLARTAWKQFWSERGWKHEARPLLLRCRPSRRWLTARCIRRPMC